MSEGENWRECNVARTIRVVVPNHDCCRPMRVKPKNHGETYY